MIRTSGLKSADREIARLMKGVVVDTEEMMTVILMGISANTKPYVPVDTSTLINSETRDIFTEKVRRFFFFTGPTEIVGEIAYGRVGSVNARGTPVHKYAAYVHEGPQKNWQKPGASNQFLAKGARDFAQDDLAGIIARYSR